MDDRKNGPPYLKKSYASIFLRDLLRLTPWRFFRKAGIKFFYDHSPFAASIISNPGGFEALDKIYMNRPETWLDRILLGLRACEGTRQRHHIYQHLLHSYIGKIPDHQNNICVLDLGSGAGRALLQVAYERICISPCLAQNIKINAQISIFEIFIKTPLNSCELRKYLIDP